MVINMVTSMVMDMATAIVIATATGGAKSKKPLEIE